MAYFGIWTTRGLELLAEAQATYTPMVIDEVAVGDGNGAEITPLASMTALENETARVSTNLIEVDPENANQVRVEGLIPAATGGFTIREVGLFVNDELVAIASHPPTYKPTPAEGVSVEAYIRMLLVYANPTEAIELTADLSVEMATRQYVQQRVGHEFGDGSDGDVVVSSTVTITRDMYYDNLTISAGGTLNTGGFRVFVKGTLTTSGGGAIKCVGADGPAGAGGAAAGTVGTLKSGAASTGASGSNGTNKTNSLGGAGGDGAGGTGGTVTPPVAGLGGARSLVVALLGHILGIAGGVSAWTAIEGGASGATGLGNAGAGAGGGVMVLAARHLVLENASDITVAGGNGNTGQGTGGGGGGVLFLIYGDKLPGLTFDAATNAAGGLRGTLDGSDGDEGTVIQFELFGETP